MDEYTIKNTNAILLAFAILSIWVWLIMVAMHPFALWIVLCWFLIIITIDRYREVKHERQSRR